MTCPACCRQPVCTHRRSGQSASTTRTCPPSISSTLYPYLVSMRCGARSAERSNSLMASPSISTTTVLPGLLFGTAIWLYTRTPSPISTITTIRIKSPLSFPFVFTNNTPKMAEGVGFEPTEGANPRRFSRPLHSSTLAPFLSLIHYIATFC